MDDDAGRLVDDQQVLVLVGDRERGRVGRVAATARSAARSGSTVAPPRLAALRRMCAWAERARRPGPGRLRSRAGRVRGPERLRQEAVEPRPGLPRAPSARAGHRARSRSAASARARRPSSTSSERDHPERDRHVGDVERRPVPGSLMKSITEPVAMRSIRLPTRAADQHPGGQPQPRPLGPERGSRPAPTSATAVNTSTSAPPPETGRRTRRRCCGRGRG